MVLLLGTEFLDTAALLRFLPPTPTELLTCQRSAGIPAKIAWQNACTKRTLNPTLQPTRLEAQVNTGLRSLDSPE